MVEVIGTIGKVSRCTEFDDPEKAIWFIEGLREHLSGVRFTVVVDNEIEARQFFGTGVMLNPPKYNEMMIERLDL